MIPPHLEDFWAAPRLATMGTVGGDGTVHLVPVRCTRVGEEILVLTRPETVKVRNVVRTGRATVAEHTDSLWVTVEGPARVSRDPGDLAAARAAYERRFGRPESGWATCVVVLTPDRVLHGS